MVVSQPTRVHEQSGHVEVRHLEFTDTRYELVSEVIESSAYFCEDAMNDNEAEPNREAYRYENVFSCAGVQVFCQCPCCCLRVHTLERLSRPDIVSVRVRQQITMRIDDGDHDDIVYECAKDCSPDLRDEHCARGDLYCRLDMNSKGLTVFAHLQVAGEIETLCNDAVRPRREIEITDRSPGDDHTRDHLHERVGRDSVTESGVKERALRVRTILRWNSRKER